MSTTGSPAIEPARSWGELIPPLARVRIGIIAVLMAFAYWGPIRYALIKRWLNDGNWSHGWLVPLFSLYFLAMRWDKLRRVRPHPSYVGGAILLLSLTGYFVSAWWWSMTYPQAVSIVSSIFGVTLLLGGWSVMRIAWFPILFLMLAIPLPKGIYVQLTQPLREWASSAAAAIMPVFASGLHTEAQAVVIDYYMAQNGVYGQLNVEEACSGMRLMMAFVTLGIAMAYLGSRPAWQRVIMVLCCVPIAVFCNTIRVTTTGLFIVHGHKDLASGTLHQLLGMLMLVVALGLFALVGYVLSHLFVEVPDDGAVASEAQG